MSTGRSEWPRSPTSDCGEGVAENVGVEPTRTLDSGDAIRARKLTPDGTGRSGPDPPDSNQRGAGVMATRIAAKASVPRWRFPDGGNLKRGDADPVVPGRASARRRPSTDHPTDRFAVPASGQAPRPRAPVRPVAGRFMSRRPRASIRHCGGNHTGTANASGVRRTGTCRPPAARTSSAPQNRSEAEP